MSGGLLIGHQSRFGLDTETHLFQERLTVGGYDRLWLVDARKKQLFFEIQHHGAAGYETAPADAKELRPSRVFGRSFRLDRERDRLGHWTFDLQSRPAAAYTPLSAAQWKPLRNVAKVLPSTAFVVRRR